MSLACALPLLLLPVVAVPPVDTEVEVRFDGEREAAGTGAASRDTEVEVAFGEEEAAPSEEVEVAFGGGAAKAPVVAPVPEIGTTWWLGGLPLLGLALLAWHVRWRVRPKPRARRTTRPCSRPAAGEGRPLTESR